MSKSFKNFESEIRLFCVPYLREEQRIKLRNVIMKKVKVGFEVNSYVLTGEQEVFSQLMDKETLADSLMVSPIKKSKIRESLLMKIDAIPRKSWDFASFWPRVSRLAAAAVSFIFVIFLFDGSLSKAPIAFAETFAMVDAVNGNASIERGGKSVTPTVGMLIYENDVLITGEDGFLTITYGNQSVSRLGNFTKLTVRDFNTLNGGEGLPFVDLSLESGRVWSKIIGAEENNNLFRVVVSDSIQASTKKGAFNLAVDDNQISLEVFNNNVEVLNLSKNVKPQTVVSGHKIIADQAGVEVREIGKEEKRAGWIQENLDEDRNYLVLKQNESIDQQLLLVANVKPEILDTEASIIGETDDTAIRFRKFDQQERLFVEAYLNLSDPTLSLDEKLNNLKQLSKFELYVNHLIDDLEKELVLGNEEFDYVGYRNYLELQIAENKKSLAFVLPDSDSYAAKDVVFRLEQRLNVVGGEVDNVRLLKDLLRRYYEIEDLIYQDRSLDVAAANLKVYNQEFELLLKTVDEDSSTQQKIVDEIKILSAGIDKLLIESALDPFEGEQVGSVEVVEEEEL